MHTAESPSGLSVELNVPTEGLLSPSGIAQSAVKRVAVKLPLGVTINPAAGEGLGYCTPEQYASETAFSPVGTGCPSESKLGTVGVTTPLLATPIPGNVYLAQQYENPFKSLLALYVVAKDPNTGVIIRVPGEVSPDPMTGQLTTTFDDLPQAPFSRLLFTFREGQRSPLATPSTCGTYTTDAALTPWSEPSQTINDSSSFEITAGVAGGPCPSGGVAPFTPQAQAGSVSPVAGAYTPFYLRLIRNDGEQEITSFSATLPLGLSGNLTGVPFCPEAAIAAARANTGVGEVSNPSCPAASQIGHTLVGVGVGSDLTYVPGKIYLAGPYRGAPFSIVSVTPATVGPFDLGTVVVRFGLNINPYTAQVSVTQAGSDPIPHIIDGIVVHVRDVHVYIDRPDFTINPTNCTPTTVTADVFGFEGSTSVTATPFDVTDCKSLAFGPKFTVSTSSRTSRAEGASLAVKLTYPAGVQANIAKVKVELPKALPSRLSTLQKACTQAQFEANPAGCPAASAVGRARATTPILPVPLEGPAYFVSHGGEAFPSLVVVLQGYGVTVDLVGTTFISKAGITKLDVQGRPRCSRGVI